MDTHQSRILADDEQPQGRSNVHPMREDCSLQIDLLDVVPTNPGHP